MSSGTDSTHSANKPAKCGGINELRSVTEDDLKIWDLYKEPLEAKIRERFDVPADYEFKPVQVATQVVGGHNYFFKVGLPNQKYVTARVYHVPWKKDTHGKHEQVAVHDKLHDSPHENVEHF